MAPKKLAAAKAADGNDSRLMASGFIAAMKAPSSSKEQKAALEYYQGLPRFSDGSKIKLVFGSTLTRRPM